jgi:hypothetical protein
LNVPVPEVVQTTLEADPPITPVSVYPKYAQIVASVPADTVAIGLIVKVIASTAAAQGPAPSGSLDVIVRVTVPSAMSAASGV